MSVDRTYRCDLCNTREPPTGGADLFGIYWAAVNSSSLEIRGVRTVEHHLCRECIEAIKRFDIPKAIA